MKVGSYSRAAAGVRSNLRAADVALPVVVDSLAVVTAVACTVQQQQL
jgi:hypothetical protein